MKKLFIIAAVMLLGTLAKAQDAKSIYNKFSDEQGVSAVYISPSMFKLIGKLLLGYIQFSEILRKCFSTYTLYLGLFHYIHAALFLSPDELTQM